MNEPRMVFCKKLGKEAPGLPFKPFTDDFDSTSIIATSRADRAIASLRICREIPPPREPVFSVPERRAALAQTQPGQAIQVRATTPVAFLRLAD